MKFFTAICLLMCVAFNASAAEDRAAKIRTLLDAQGLTSRLETQSDLGKKEGAKVAHRMMGKMMSKLAPSHEFRARFEAVYVNFLNSLDSAGSQDDIVRVWTEEYGAKFSDEELDKLIAFYTSDLGKKHMQANEDALPGFTKKFTAVREPLYQKAMNAYVGAMASVAEECNCPKK